MQFKSLAVFFQHLQIDITTVGADNIGRIRKVVNAEFAMSDSGIIEVGELSYSKQDLQSVLDAEDALEILKTHQIISENKLFSEFLKNGNLHPQIRLEIAKLKGNLKVLALTSSEIAAQFNKSQRKLLSAGQFNNAAQQMDLLPMIAEKDYDVAFQAIREYLEQGVYLFKNTNKVTHFNKISEIQLWTLEWAQWANVVPGLFLELKRELVLKLINYSVAIQYVDRKVAYYISCQLIKLNFLANTNSQLVYNNHSIYEKNVSKLKILPKEIQRVYNREWSKGVTLGLIIGVFFLGKIIFSVLEHNDNKEKTKIENIESYQDAAEGYLIKKEANLFNNFKTFEKDSSVLLLSEKANLISYVYADTTKGGIKIKNSTDKDFVLSLSLKDGLFDVLLKKGKIIDFNYENGETINFLLLADITMEGQPLKTEQLIGGNWIAFKEAGKNIDINNLVMLNPTSGLEISNPKPPKFPLKLNILKTGDKYFLQHEGKIEYATKQLEQ